jgi:lipopolysaccharide/colanic/teichoic acid biosynthesis glycosyltransferase
MDQFLNSRLFQQFVYLCRSVDFCTMTVFSSSDSIQTSFAAPCCEQMGVCQPIGISTRNDSRNRHDAISGLKHRARPWWKRGFDIVVASLLLAILFPVMAVIGLYIRAVSKGPMLFKQKRLGEMGKYFVIYKFRTLKLTDPHHATETHRKFLSELIESDQVAAKPDFGSRLIPGGGFLRSRSLDELPQLLNVLMGQMSLIGPRPDVLDWDDYSEWQLRRFEVTPGITGLWQVSGKNRLTFSQMVSLDIEYIEKRSFLFDLWILAKTFKLVIKNDNK